MSAPSEPQPLPPSELRLRGDLPLVTRLSRKTLAVIGGVAAIAIGGASFYALQPSSPKPRTELYETGNRAVTDGLAGAPKDYSQVPKLGPPLPGDLGRPILSAQQRGVDVSTPTFGAPPAAPSGGASNPAQAARERVRQEGDAARLSKMFASSEGSGMPAAVPLASGMSLVSGASQLPAASTEAPPNAEGSQVAKRSFLHAAQTTPTESSYRLEQPASPYVVQAGSIIPAALITGIRSDLPGMITAQVTQNVYDSASGRYLLIPQGSRLIGEYDSQVSFGQNRVLLAWDRLILPDGRSLQLDRLQGADASGYSGVGDRVNQHWGGMLRAAFVSMLLGVGTEVGSAGDSELVKALRQGASDTVARTGQDLVRRQMSVQPTLTIRPGFQVRVIVARDLVLATGDAK